jgi:glycosyltransferase involved in cell wall biosynthesis
MPAPHTLAEVIQEFGLGPHVRLYTKFVTDDVYRDYFIACDASVQLRLYGLGQPSAALADSIAAGVPSVASDELAATCEAPSYVRTVPAPSPLLLAEALANIYESRSKEESRAFNPERIEYCNKHSFEQYSLRLKTVLGW